jgi:hypothetical protein
MMLRRSRWAAARRWASSPVPRQHPLLHRQRQCPLRAPSKWNLTESQSQHQPTKQVRDTSPTPTLMHSKHAGPSVTTVPVQRPPKTSKHPRGGTEEGWKKMDRSKGKGKRENKVGTRSAGGVPTWADIARASTSLYKRGRWLHQTEGTPAGRKGQEEAARAPATRFFFDGRMKGKRGAHFFCLTFCLFLLSGRQMGRRRKGRAQKVASRLQAQDSVFFCPV